MGRYKYKFRHKDMKKYIEHDLFSDGAEYIQDADATTVSGPATMRTNRLLRKTMARNSTINHVEINKREHLNQQRKLTGLPKVKATLGDIAERRFATRVVDADLTATYRTIGPTIHKALRQQREANPGVPKFFVFTFSLRGVSLRETLAYIQEHLAVGLLNTPTKATESIQVDVPKETWALWNSQRDGNKPVYCRRFFLTPTAESEIIKCKLYSYSTDNTPMLTGHFIYN